MPPLHIYPDHCFHPVQSKRCKAATGNSPISSSCSSLVAQPSAAQIPLKMHLFLLALTFLFDSARGDTLTGDTLREEFLEKELLLLEERMDNMIEKKVVKVMADRDVEMIKMKEKMEVVEAKLEKMEAFEAKLEEIEVFDAKWEKMGVLEAKLEKLEVLEMDLENIEVFVLKLEKIEVFEASLVKIEVLETKLEKMEALETELEKIDVLEKTLVKMEVLEANLEKMEALEMELGEKNLTTLALNCSDSKAELNQDLNQTLVTTTTSKGLIFSSFAIQQPHISPHHKSSLGEGGTKRFMIHSAFHLSDCVMCKVKDIQIHLH